MRDARLVVDDAQTQLVERRLELPSVAALTQLIESGTVPLATLLRAQPADNRNTILRALEGAAARYTVPAGLSIPVVAALAVANRPRGNDGS